MGSRPFWCWFGILGWFSGAMSKKVFWSFVDFSKLSQKVDSLLTKYTFWNTIIKIWIHLPMLRQQKYSLAPLVAYFWCLYWLLFEHFCSFQLHPVSLFQYFLVVPLSNVVKRLLMVVDLWFRVVQEVLAAYFEVCQLHFGVSSHRLPGNEKRPPRFGLFEYFPKAKILKLSKSLSNDWFQILDLVPRS